MTSIDRNELSNVRGGFGALLGALAQSAGPILQGVGSIIAASKSGGGGGGAAGAGAAAAAQPPQRGGVDGGTDPLVSVTVASGAAFPRQ